MDLAFAIGGLEHAGTVVPAAEIRGFDERYDPWTGRLWLTVRGPGWRVAVGPGWGALRRELRKAFPDRPFTSSWDDGRFPGPRGPALLTAGLAGVAAAVAWELGLAWGAAVVLAGAWPLGRARDSAEIARDGVRLGPAWGPVVPWHRVDRLTFSRHGRAAVVWASGADGAWSASVPAVLIPALRARLRRLGALDLVEAAPDLDHRYGSWRAAAAGIPWGALVGSGVCAVFARDPTWVMMSGLVVTAGVAVLGQAVEARGTGWGFGSVMWLTGLYGVVLALVGIAAA